MRDGDGGQATVELALVLPLLVTLLLALVQVGIAARDQILVVHGARVAVREAAVDPRPASVRSAALRATAALDPGALEVVTSASRGATATVTTRLRYRSRTRVPIVGLLLPDLVLRAEATMRAEGDRRNGAFVPSVDFPQEPRHRRSNPTSW